MSLTFLSVLRKLYTEPSIGASYQISVHLATWFQRGRIFRNNRKKNCLWWPFLLTDRDEMSNLYRGHSIDASHQALVHLAKQFQRRRFFRNRPIRNKNCLWWPCLLMYQDEMSNLMTFHRWFLPSFGFNLPIRNKNGLWWPCLLMDRDEMSNLNRGPSMDASYQVSVNLAKQFQRRRFM